MLKIMILPALFLCAAIGCQATFSGMTLSDAFPDVKVRALIEAAQHKDSETASSLVKQGADPNYVGKDGILPLVWVSVNANSDWAEVTTLLDAGADPNKKFSDGDSVISVAAAGDKPDYLLILLQHGGNANATGMHGQPIIADAAEGERLENVRILLEHGANINAHDQARFSAAIAASAVGAYDIVIYLLEHGYSYDLPRLAEATELRVISPKSVQCAAKIHVLEILHDRGVTLPARSDGHDGKHFSNRPDPCLPSFYPLNWRQ